MHPKKAIVSITTNLVKTAIKFTPNKMVMWVANIKLKGIAELTDFSFDLDTRKTYVKVMLLGEAEPIELSLDGFAVVSDGESNKLIIQQAQSNKPWLDNILAAIVGKEWKIPVIPQFQAYIDILLEVFKTENKTQSEEVVDENENTNIV
jgi:hypothetical protein